MKKLDFDTWNRKEHFEFFYPFDEPFFGVVSEVDCTKAYEYTKKNNISFFAYYLHKTLEAANSLEEFKYRIIGKEVFICNEIHAAATIAREDGTFAFSFTEFNPDFTIFHDSLSSEIDSVQNSTGLRFNEDAKRIDGMHISSFPWHKLTGLTHSRDLKRKDSVPKITFGKTYVQDSAMKLPIAINVHHALMDGFHVAQFLDRFQELLDN